MNTYVATISYGITITQTVHLILLADNEATATNRAADYGTNHYRNSRIVEVHEMKPADSGYIHVLHGL